MEINSNLLYNNENEAKFEEKNDANKENFVEIENNIISNNAS